jgi:carbonic anhydrase
VDYFQSVSHDINERVSHEAEEKQKLHGNKNQTDMTSLKNEEIHVINSVNNILTVDNIHASRRVRRSERSTHTNIPSLIQQYVNYFHNYCANHNQPLSQVGFFI